MLDGGHRPVPPAPRRIGAVNWIGVGTLYRREMMRFVKIVGQTLLAPIVTTLLFLAVFSLALGSAVETVHGLPFLVFLGPGLAMMAMAQSSFQATAGALIVLKIQGTIVDVLMPPLTADELTFGFAAAGTTRGLAVGAAVTAAMAPFVPLPVEAPLAALFFAVNACLLLALVGLVAGIVGNKFDHIAFVANFVVTPFAFLSGTFYSIDRLPEDWAPLAHANPFFHMIDGFRYGFTGQSDGSPLIGAIVLVALNALLWTVVRTMFARGYKLKS